MALIYYCCLFPISIVFYAIEPWSTDSYILPLNCNLTRKCDDEGSRKLSLIIFFNNSSCPRLIHLKKYQIATYGKYIVQAQVLLLILVTLHGLLCTAVDKIPIAVILQTKLPWKWTLLNWHNLNLLFWNCYILTWVLLRQLYDSF